MGVMLQAFYWDCPKAEEREHQWWAFTQSKLPSIAQDYFNWDLAPPNTQSGIDALIKVHGQNAAGPTQVLFVNDDLYIMQRPGNANQSGLVFVLNNSGNWNGAWIQTRSDNMQLVPTAWRGRDDLSMPQQKWTNDSGWVDLWAAPRGYAVYLPK